MAIIAFSCSNEAIPMKLPVLMTPCLALSRGGTGAVAQTQNSAQTGAGGAPESLEALQAEVNEKWAGPPGQIVKGAVGLAGLVAALSAAQSALTFQLQLRGDGSLAAGSSASVNTATSISTATTTSSSTSTN
jgi:hypothetical protein